MSTQTLPLLSTIFLHQEGLMSFEEESIDAALKALEETEKKCQVGEGFMKSMRKKFSKKKRKEVH